MSSWPLMFSSYLQMFPHEDEGQKKLIGIIETHSRGRSIRSPLVPLVHVMNHHWLHPHLSLSDKGRPQSDIHTLRAHSFFSIVLHPWLFFSAFFTLSQPFFPPFKFFLLVLTATAIPSLLPVLRFRGFLRCSTLLNQPPLYFPHEK